LRRLAPSASPKSTTPMEVTINGEGRELPDEMTVAALLEHFGVDGTRTVVEVNREIIPREEYGATPVAEGDVLELVEIVGGG
jgi:sulfur carrier protein